MLLLLHPASPNASRCTVTQTRSTLERLLDASADLIPASPKCPRRRFLAQDHPPQGCRASSPGQRWPPAVTLHPETVDAALRDCPLVTLVSCLIKFESIASLTVLAKKYVDAASWQTGGVSFQILCLSHTIQRRVSPRQPTASPHSPEKPRGSYCSGFLGELVWYYSEGLFIQV